MGFPHPLQFECLADAGSKRDYRSQGCVYGGASREGTCHLKAILVSSQELQWGHASGGGDIWQGSEHDPWYSKAGALGGAWSSEFL